MKYGIETDHETQHNPLELVTFLLNVSIKPMLAVGISGLGCFEP